MNCKKCGNIINNETLICPVCGENNVYNENANTTNQLMESNNSTNKNSKTKKIIILIIIIIGCILMFGIGLFVGKNLNKTTNDCLVEENLNDTSKENNYDSTETKKYTHNLFVPSEIEKIKNTTELGKNVTIEEIFFNSKYNEDYKYKNASFYGKNNNSMPVEINIILEYYDSEGYRIEKTSEQTMVQPGREFVVEINIEDDSLNYDKIKLTYEVNKIKSYYTIINDENIKITSDLVDDDQISIIVENTYDKEIRGDIACLYYKNKKLVFAQKTYASVEANKKSTANCSGYKLKLNEDYKNPEKIEFDEFKVVLHSAYNYDSNY